MTDNPSNINNHIPESDNEDEDGFDVVSFDFEENEVCIDNQSVLKEPVENTDIKKETDKLKEFREQMIIENKTEAFYHKLELALNLKTRNEKNISDSEYRANIAQQCINQSSDDHQNEPHNEIDEMFSDHWNQQIKEARDIKIQSLVNIRELVSWTQEELLKINDIIKKEHEYMIENMKYEINNLVQYIDNNKKKLKMIQKKRKKKQTIEDKDYLSHSHIDISNAEIKLKNLIKNFELEKHQSNTHEW